ncbi:MAG TPA: GAF domain-containing protein [Chthoniobacteraceae bacterium]|jgi:signal transduction protein with GAF and PtsI domain|nr:GAF domain-containing protein [Chthoniobacteraceae bacterium]
MISSTELESALTSGTPADVLRGTLDYFQCQAGTVHLMKDGALALAAHINIPPPIVQIVQMVPIGKGIAGLAAERREPVSLCNLQTDASGQALPAAKTTGMEGSLAVPMLHGAELRGVLGIAKAQAHDWTEAEKAEVLAIAARLAARI